MVLSILIFDVPDFLNKNIFTYFLNIENYIYALLIAYANYQILIASPGWFYNYLAIISDLSTYLL